ncbi:ArsC family reductase [Terasakiispira papahanaumokuakeensis]|uniref:ArsC family reductase n=1 Tax=Terasakiispira papahanaumokuakeensis TaxID=197479 RepID=UPI000A573618|nr:ArsC family reductase [Terasakiispira papahanaumokuakeensis]
MIELYGIPNCNTMKKARTWLVEAGLEYDFHDYKKVGITLAHLSAWADQVGWEILLNKRGTTWRNLPDEAKAEVGREQALRLMVEHPSLIKRPVLIHPKGIEVGFDADRYRAALLEP